MRVVIAHDLRLSSRVTNLHYLRSLWQNSSADEVVFVNAFGPISDRALGADLVIVSYELVSLRNAPFWRSLVDRLTPILKSASKRILIPQDDYTSCVALDQFAHDFEFDAVYSGILNDLEVLYPMCVKKGVRFEHAYAGYAPATDEQSFAHHTMPFRERPYDLVQRIRHLPPQFGELGTRKAEITEKLAAFATQANFKVDVSTRDEDVLIGDMWLKFLGSSRFTTGRKGGASAADPFSKNADRIRRLQMRKPLASQDDMSRRLRERHIRRGDFSAISPRVFESAALRTCQILEVDSYFEDFEPWTHYVPIESDFSNIQQVLDVMRDIERAEEIAENCWHRLIVSGEFSYRAFAVRLFARELGGTRRLEATEYPMITDSSEVLCPVYVDVKTIKNAQAICRTAIQKGLVKGRSNPQSFEEIERSLSRSPKVAAAFKENNNGELRLLVAQWITAWCAGELIPESLIFDWASFNWLAHQ